MAERDTPVDRGDFFSDTTVTTLFDSTVHILLTFSTLDKPSWVSMAAFSFSFFGPRRARGRFSDSRFKIHHYRTRVLGFQLGVLSISASREQAGRRAGNGASEWRNASVLTSRGVASAQFEFEHIIP